MRITSVHWLSTITEGQDSNSRHFDTTLRKAPRAEMYQPPELRAAKSKCNSPYRSGLRCGSSLWHGSVFTVLPANSPYCQQKAGQCVVFDVRDMSPVSSIYRCHVAIIPNEEKCHLRGRKFRRNKVVKALGNVRIGTGTEPNRPGAFSSCSYSAKCVGG